MELVSGIIFNGLTHIFAQKTGRIKLVCPELLLFHISTSEYLLYLFSNGYFILNKLPIFIRAVG